VARGVRLSAWALLAALLAAMAGLAWFVPRELLDWQPGLALREPWRALTAALVHWSALHLGANLLGAVVVAAFGWAARLPAAAAVAWLAAWPLTQLGLLLRPDLLHYGGLSGVLHAGVAVAALWLVFDRRWLGVAVSAGLVIKVLLEAPWGPPLRELAGWDIRIAPFAHATGAVAGTACALCVLLARRARGRRMRRQSALKN
jgi:rhomboid family GlyGly-CTERM serine protease